MNNESEPAEHGAPPDAKKLSVKRVTYGGDEKSWAGDRRLTLELSDGQAVTATFQNEGDIPAAIAMLRETADALARAFEGSLAGTTELKA